MVKITAPAAASKQVRPDVLFTGSVTENGPAPLVEFSLDGKSWNPAAITKPTNPYGWSANVSLNPGNNTVTIRATDLANNVSTPVSLGVSYTIPVPTITAPAAGASVQGSSANVTGLLAYPGSGFPKVEVSADGGSSWQNVTLSGSKSPYSWNAVVALTPGANTILVRAVDVPGRTGDAASRVVNALVPSTTALAIPVSSGGTVTGSLAGKNLNLGMPYTVTARPGTGMIFKEWLKNDVPFSRSATLTFTMEEGLTLTPVFIPNPFPAIAGVFDGLAGTAGDTALSSFVANNGAVTATVSPTGALSGTVRLGGLSIPFSGTLDGYGEISLNLVRRGLAPLALSLSFDFEQQPATASGTLEAMDIGQISFVLRSSGFTGAANSIHPLNKRLYTIALPSPDWNLGHGFARVTVDARGSTQVAGKLADGTTFTSISRMARVTGQGLDQWIVPTFAPLYTSRGVLSGILALDIPTSSAPAETPDVSGTLTWGRPVNAAPALELNSDVLVLNVVGAPLAVTKGISLLSGTSQSTTFSLAIDKNKVALDPTLVVGGTWPSTNSPTLNAPVLKGLSFSFAASTVSFQGGFLRPTNVSTRYEGIILGKPVQLTPGSDPVSGCGFFLMPGASGSVELQVP